MSLIKLISKKKSSYTDAFNKKDLVLDIKDLASIDKIAKLLGKSQDTKMLDIRHILSKDEYTISS